MANRLEHPMNAVTTQIVNPKDLTAADRQRFAERLYRLHHAIFDGVEREDFDRYVVNSSAAETRIGVFVGADGEWGGYAAIHRFEVSLGGRCHMVIRAEAGLLKAYRKRGLGGRFIAREATRMRLRHPLSPMVYLGTLVHPSSYAAFHDNATGVWPGPDAPTPEPIARLMETLSTSVGLSPIDPAVPGVCKVGWITRDRACDDGYWRRSDNEGVRFFLRANPGYGRGEGLVTVVQMSWSNVVTGLARYLSRRVRVRSTPGSMLESRATPAGGV